MCLCVCVCENNDILYLSVSIEVPPITAMIIGVAHKGLCNSYLDL